MREKRSGIYLIVCLKNGKRYVGSASDFSDRWKWHRNRLRKGKNGSPKLQNSWTKHGEGAFAFSVLEVVADRSKLIEREQHWIDTLRPELNSSLIAFPARLGMRNGPEMRRKISEGNRRYWASLTPEQRRERATNMAAARGPASADTRAKMSESARRYAAAHPGIHRGRKQSPETVAKMRLATRAQWEKSRPEREAKRAAWEAGREAREMERRRKVSAVNKGKTLKRATKRKLRAAAQEQWNDPAYRAKHQEATRAAMKDPAVLQRLSESHRGKKLSERQKRKIGKAHRGRKKSPETIAKMREARRLWWQKHKADA